MSHKVEFELGGRTMTIESGHLAKQANGAVTVRYGDSMVISTVCAGTEPRTEFDFFPLTVEYREKSYAAGKIPGGCDCSIPKLYSDHFRLATGASVISKTVISN